MSCNIFGGCQDRNSENSVMKRKRISIPEAVSYGNFYRFQCSKNKLGST